MDTEHSEKELKQVPVLPDAFSLFGLSWKAFKLNWVIFVFGTLLPIVVILLLVAILQIFVHFHLNSTDLNHTLIFVNVLSVVMGLAVVLVGLPIAYALLYYVKLQSAKGIKLSYWPAIRTSLHYFWRLIGLGICRGFVILLGFVALIVPGFFMWRRYLLAPYYLVDEDIGVFEAMRRSSADSKPFSGPLWGVIGVLTLVSIVGSLPFIGFLGAGAGIVYCCATATRYLQVKAAKK